MKLIDEFKLIDNFYQTDLFKDFSFANFKQMARENKRAIKYAYF